MEAVSHPHDQAARKGKAAQEKSPWWHGGVIYQIYPRSFQDTSGDGIGDLRGVTDRLPHIASLGVDAIWLSPFFKSPMEDMGYDVSDYLSVDPMFGSLEDFDALLREAHRLGLKVIIDQVLSHTSDQHEWFVESRSSRDNPRADWYVWADPKPDGTAPNNWLSIFGGPAWEWDGVRRQYYMHNFLRSQPDLNFHNPDVQNALLDVVRFWLERGVDGFRLDTVNFFFHDKQLRDNPALPRNADSDNFLSGDIPNSNPYELQNHLYDKTQPENLTFLKRFRALLDSYDDRASVGEVGDGTRSLKTVAAYTQGGDKLHMCYTFELLGTKFSADHFRNAVTNFEEVVDDGWVCWSFSNHDVCRHVTRWMQPGDDPDHLARFCLTLLASLRGTICLYQGEELGLPEAELEFEDLTDPYGIRFWPAYKGRDGCRTPMVWDNKALHGGFSQAARTWLPVPDAHLRRAVSVQEVINSSVLHHYRETLAFRAQHEVLRDAPIHFLNENRDVLIFTRGHDGSADGGLLFAFNLSRKPVEWLVPADLKIAEQIYAPSFAPIFEGGAVYLDGLDVFCARLGK